MSQECLNVDKSPILWKNNDRCGKQTTSHESSFPIRSSSSAHNILSDGSSPTRQLRGSRPSSAGVWRTPLSQHPAPSAQPIRIDIPLTRAMKAQTSHQTTRMNQNLQNLPNPDHHIYACPLPAHKSPPQSSFPSQQQRTSAQDEGVTPTKHVSFQDPPALQRRCPRKDPEQGWRRRDAQAKLEEQRELGEVELLQQEVQRLRVKEERTLEENDRLRRLSLEWQFQKRLQEVQERRGDDGEEEEEDLDTLLVMQQLEKQTQASLFYTHVLHKISVCVSDSL